MGFQQFGLTAIMLVAFSAASEAGPVANTLDTTGYNFQLDNGGGGAQAELNKTQNIEIFCVDFANNIYVPQQNYSAYVTGLTTGDFDPNVTRFGEVSSWTQISSSVAGASIINNASDVGRYQMAAYLVSQYNIPSGNSASNTSNNGIQQAIWDILDPAGQGSFSAFGGSNTNTEVSAAASWFNNTSSSGRDTFLANYRIVSDTTMKGCTGGSSYGLLCGGFQEQITAVPEPRYLALMLVGLLIVGSAVYRRLVGASRSSA
jgi:hypothetical protein